MLPNWDGTTSGSISVKFRTNEPDGLLFFSRGQTEHTVSKFNNVISEIRTKSKSTYFNTLFLIHIFFIKSNSLTWSLKI